MVYRVRKWRPWCAPVWCETLNADFDVLALGRPINFMSSNAGSNLPDSLFAGDTNLISSPTAHLNWMVDPFLYAQPEMRICC